MAALVKLNAFDKTSVAKSNTSIVISPLLNSKEVLGKTRTGKTKRNELMKKGLFPLPVQLPGVNTEKGRTNYWFEHDIDAWLSQLLEESRQQAVKLAKDPLNAWMQNISASKKEAS